MANTFSLKYLLEIQFVLPQPVQQMAEHSLSCLCDTSTSVRLLMLILSHSLPRSSVDAGSFMHLTSCGINFTNLEMLQRIFLQRTFQFEYIETLLCSGLSGT